MRIDSEQLPQHLKRGLQPLYLVYGPELLLALEAADRIRSAAAAAGHEERTVLIAEAGFDWGELFAATDNLSLFASRRLLDLRVPARPGKEGGEALTRLAQSPPADTVTLITLAELDRQATSSKWFETLERAATAVHAATVSRERLPKWLAQRLAAQGQQAAGPTLAFLCDRVEGNLMAAHQEVQKLALLFPPGELELERVREAVLDVARFDVFELGPALLRGERAHFVRILDGLRGEGAAPPLVLWAIAEEARAMTQVWEANARGVSLQDAMREARVWGIRQQLMPAALARFERGALGAALASGAQVDRMIKGLEKGDVWDALLGLGMRLMPQPKTGASSRA
jgi:DNA polymerase III subunit delta